MAIGIGSETLSSGSLEVTHNNFIPLFDNKISSYKEWQIIVLLYGKKIAI